MKKIGMKKAFTATAMIAVSFALVVGCAAATTDASEVRLKATVKNNKVSGQWEVQTAEDFKNGEFGGKAPKSVKVGTFENIESIYANANRVYTSSDKLTLALIVDGKTVDKVSTTENQAVVEYSAD